ncbi:MAG: AAA family ATPase [Acidobacteriota bacterium]
MLRLLRIENLVLARDVQLEFGPGLNLITGETGAGKSLISGAIGLALAGRGESALVRQGEERALVEAMFDITSRPDLQQRLSRAGYETPGGELLIRRELTADGRTKVLVNGQSITIAMLKELTAGLLEMHGQNEPHTLLSPESHRTLLDRFGGTELLLAELRRVHGALRETVGRLNELAEKAAQRAARVDLLRFRVSEIETIRPLPGEEEKLRLERDRLRHAEAIAESLQGALDAVYEGEGAALEKYTPRPGDGVRWPRTTRKSANWPIDSMMSGLPCRKRLPISAITSTQ